MGFKGLFFRSCWSRCITMAKVCRVFCYRTLALCSLLLGVVGVIVPGLPTVPFVLLAGWAAHRGWPQFDIYLNNHRWTGPMLAQWRVQRAVPRTVKLLASVMVLSSLLVLWLLQSGWLVAIATLVAAVALSWLWLAVPNASQQAASSDSPSISSVSTCAAPHPLSPQSASATSRSSYENAR